MNLSRTLTIAVCAASLVTMSNYAFAKDEVSAPQNFEEQSALNTPRGFENENLKFTSISEILKNAHDHDKVIVKGKLTKFIGGEKYQLTDENNDNIVVELDDDKNWSFIAKDMPIVVFAEVDNDHMTKVLEVKHARPDRGAGFGPRGLGPNDGYGPRGGYGHHGGRGPHDGMGPRGGFGPNQGNCPVCPVCDTTSSN
ncbi:MAG: NirD/YgiW/YdeI family stress tolerance protein [Succinivibrio sp.]|nr:NirD/YgiW/YdeI family stress tolerance protein [Succinivibrio sp.]